MMVGLGDFSIFGVPSSSSSASCRNSRELNLFFGMDFFRITMRAARFPRAAFPELIAHVPRSMACRFRPRQVPVQPMPQPSTELARGFILASFAFAEEFGSALQLSGSWRRSFEMADESKQLLQLVSVQVFDLSQATICSGPPEARRSRLTGRAIQKMESNSWYMLVR